MNKKFFSLIALSLLLISCGNNDQSVSDSHDSSTSDSVSSESMQSSESSESTQSSESSESTNESSSTDVEVQTFVVTWKNYDGSVLEVDNKVRLNTMPSYDGNTPLKPKDSENIYMFNGWDPKVSIVVSDITYTATFKAMPISEISEGNTPIISEDGKTIKYGVYPISHVKDETLISKLNALDSTNSLGYFEYEGKQYAKQIAKTYNNESYTFSDNSQIVNGSTYWFNVEVITWNILSSENGSYYLLANTLLDEGIYYHDLEDRNIENNIVNPNDYLHSDIAAFLNNDFKNKAFIDASYIKDNNVFLPTRDDYLNQAYGFSSDVSILDDAKKAKVSDYALCKGAWQNNKDSKSIGCGTYWTSTPSKDFTYAAFNINSGGFMSEYAVDGNGHCIRPAIKINIK